MLHYRQAHLIKPGRFQPLRSLVVGVEETVAPENSASGPVGRDHELRTLAAALESARCGQGRLVLVGGEAGIGKTTVVEHFVKEAESAAAIVLTGVCYDVSSPAPYAPWREALSSLEENNSDTPHWFGEVHLSAIVDQSALFQDVQKRLQSVARESPLVLVLEDIHWADHESLELLRFISRTLRSVPVLVIATYRNDEITSAHPLYQALPGFVREARADRIDLRRFSNAEVHQLVVNRYRLPEEDREQLVDELVRRTDGNPFFIVEVLRSMEMAEVLYFQNGIWHLAPFSDLEIPFLIRQVLSRRIHQLDQSTREALQLAAILGYEIRMDLWLSITGMDQIAMSRVVQQAMDAYLLEQSSHSTRLRFRHALVREVLYSSLPLPWRQLQHRRIAETLAETPDADAATVAEHFWQAEDSRAERWSLEAARQARKLYAPNAIIEQLDRVLSVPVFLTTEERMEALRLRGWAYEISGMFDPANSDFVSELRAALETGNSHAEWDALIRLAELWASRDYERAGEYVEQSLNLAEKINDQSLTAYSLNRLGNWYLNNDDPEHARTHHERALEMFQHLGDRPGIATTEDLIAMTLAMGGNLIDSQRHFERARDLFQVVGDQQAISSILANLVHCGGIYQTDTMVPARMTLGECVASVEEALQTAAEIGYRTGETYALMCYCSGNGSRGNYQAALDAVERGIVVAEEIGHRQWLCAAHHLNGSLFLDLLEPNTAASHLEQALAIAREVGSRVWIRANSGLLALAELAMGQPDGAAVALETGLRTDPPALTMAERYFWRASIELALLQNDPSGAIELIDQMINATPYASRERPATRLSLLRGRALIRLEQFDEALSWLIPAQRVAREQQARPLLWRIHRELGIARAALGKRLRASEEFGQAHRLIDQIGTTLADPDMQDRFLTAAHAQVPEAWATTLLQSAKETSGGLTRRQRQVAVLIAAGQSNREISDALSISERTVETHVTAILSTLNLTSRAQIATWCVENGLAERT